MTHVQSVAKSVTSNSINYLIRVQSYNFFTVGEPSLSFQTNIEILENGWLVVGCLQKCSDYNITPFISKMSDKDYHETKGIYHGEEGLKNAEEYLQELTEAQLIEAIRRTFNNYK